MGAKATPGVRAGRGQGKDVFHQLCHFGACEILDLRGKALNRAAQIAKAVGALGAFAFLQILLSILQTLQLVLFLCKLRLGSFLFAASKFGKINTENQTVDWSHYAKS